MKSMNLKASVISLILVLVLAVGTLPGCVTIAPPQTTNPPTTTTPSPPPTPINPTWTPPPTANQTEALPSIADVVALVKPSVVAINTEVVSYDFFNRPFTQEGAGSGWIWRLRCGDGYATRPHAQYQRKDKDKRNDYKLSINTFHGYLYYSILEKY